LFHVTHENTDGTFFERVICPFCFRPKRYQIPFCRVQKGIRYRMQNRKNLGKLNSIALISYLILYQIPSCTLQKGV
jgi:hypothetical protein